MGFFDVNESFCWSILLALVHSLWIGVAIGIFAWIGNRALRERNANARYWLNFLSLTVFALLLPLLFLVGLPMGQERAYPNQDAIEVAVVGNFEAAIEQTREDPDTAESVADIGTAVPAPLSVSHLTNSAQKFGQFPRGPFKTIDLAQTI